MVAENVELVGAARTQWRNNLSKAERSFNLRSMRYAAHKPATRGPSMRRVAPSIDAVRIEVLGYTQYPAQARMDEFPSVGVGRS